MKKATTNKHIIFIGITILIYSICLVLVSNAVINDTNNGDDILVTKPSAFIHSPDQRTEESSAQLTSLTTKTNKDNDNHGVLEELDVLSRSGGSTDTNVKSDDNEEEKSQKCPPPLQYYPNRIVRTATEPTVNNKNNTLIPRIIHMSWKSRCLTRDQLEILNVWETSFPHHSIFLHDDQAVSYLLSLKEWPEFPNLHRALKCVLFKGAMRIDIWRVLITYQYGGMYTDIDNIPGSAFQQASWESIIPPEASGFFISDSFMRPTQNWYAIESHHPIMYLALRGIIINILNMPNIHKPRIVQVTGPHAMAQGYYNFLAPRCCNGTMDRNAVYAENQMLTGMLEKQVIKRSNKRSEYVIPKPGYGEIVPYNSTLNMTRRERIVMDTGVAHWQDAVNSVRKPRRVPKSCAGYLAKLESGLVRKLPSYD